MVASTVVFDTLRQFGESGKIVATCTASSTAATFIAPTLPQFNGRLVAIQTNPGAVAPTDNYDITLIDQDGLDRLNGAGLNRDTANSERAPVPGSPLVVMGDSLTLTIANNAVNSAVVVVSFYYDETGYSEAAAGTGVAGTPAGGVMSVQGVTSGTPVAVGNHNVGIPVTPTLDTNAYASGDCLHTAVMAFANAVTANGGSGTITKLVVIDIDGQSAPGELWLFASTVTPAAANAAHTVSDGDAALCIGVIPFGPYYASASAANAISVNASVRLPIVLTGTSLFAIAVRSEVAIR